MNAPASSMLTVAPGIVRVAVTHDDPVSQAGLVVALGRIEGLRACEAEGRAALASDADVVVADLPRGLAHLAAIDERCSQALAPNVLIVTSDDRESAVNDALRRGARGYMLAGGSVADLAHAVREVHAGRVHLDPRVAQRVAEGLYRESLTAREVDVLRGVVAGRCNKEIATRLDVAVGTVKSHLRAIFGKLEVGSRTQAIAAAAQRGLLGVEPVDMPCGRPAPGLRATGGWDHHLARAWAARQRDLADAD
jgi:DNA-binding NarL/FixJ family response regulator